jgi:RNA polymerase sigma factor (sigma-70 family)
MNQPGIDQRRWVVAAIDQYEVRLLRFAARLLGDEHAARDAVQHAFLRLCSQSAEQLDGRVGPWLFAVCRNYAADVFRKRGGILSSGDVAACCDPALDPVAAAQRAEQHDALGRLLGQLPPAQREAVLLWAEGFRYRQIAEMTGATEGSVRVTVHRALERLRSHPEARRMRE